MCPSFVCTTTTTNMFIKCTHYHFDLFNSLVIVVNNFQLLPLLVQL